MARQSGNIDVSSLCETSDAVKGASLKKAYFFSDLHLGASYAGESIDRERKAVRFLEEISSDAAEIYLLGDIIDYWFEYRYVVPRGYVRFFGKLAELSDRGIKITWLIGNHDIWIFDYIPNELGVEVVDGILDRNVLGSARMVMAHGDHVWGRSLGFGLIRAIFRNRICQRLYSAVHPRWTVPLAYKWSNSSRKAGYLADISLDASTQARLDEERGVNENVRLLEDFCNCYDASLPPGEVKPEYYLFGHLHKVVERRLKCNAEMIVIGDWLTHFSYAVYDGECLKMACYSG